MEIIGHKRQRQFLQKTVELKKFSHAYLFTGQEKLGKKKMALEWISLLFGKDVQKNYHPDLFLIEPQMKEIQIGQIRNLIWKLSLKLYSAPLKAVVIDKAHLMNQEAQSAFLKILEEPRGETLLVLITEFPAKLFPTILSRVQTLKFYPVKKEEIKEYLRKKGISEKETEEITKISMGRPGVLIDFISDSQKIKVFEQRIKKLNKISSSPLSFCFQYAKDLSQDPQETKETLAAWLLYFRQALISAITEKRFISLAEIHKFKNIIEQIQNTNFLISTTNVNPKLALEILMLEV